MGVVLANIDADEIGGAEAVACRCNGGGDLFCRDSSVCTRTGWKVENAELGSISLGELAEIGALCSKARETGIGGRCR